jgi:CrcB protein
MDRGLLTSTAAVAAGGAIGAVARYWVSGVVARLRPLAVFPWGTFVVNVTGACLLGVLMAATTSGRLTMSPTARTFIAVGVLGAFTTFSTFTYETLEAVRLHHWPVAGANVALSLAAGLAGAWVGLALGARL